MKKLILITAALMFTAITAQASGGVCPFASDRNTKTAVNKSKVNDILGGSSKPSSK